jgi:hypothetical protein
MIVMAIITNTLDERRRRKQIKYLGVLKESSCM